MGSIPITSYRAFSQKYITSTTSHKSHFCRAKADVEVDKDERDR